MLQRLPTSIFTLIVRDWIGYHPDWFRFYLRINHYLHKFVWNLCIKYSPWSILKCDSIPFEAESICTFDERHFNIHRKRLRWMTRKQPKQNIIESLPNVQFLIWVGTMKQAFPNSITRLRYGYLCVKPMTIDLPNQLTSLHFDPTFNQPIRISLPETLTFLGFGMQYNQPFFHPLPPNLERLFFGKHFNQRLDILPLHLTWLHFTHNGCFDQLLPTLPTTLESLVMPGGYPHDVVLPCSLKKCIASPFWRLPTDSGLPELMKLCLRDWPDTFDFTQFPNLHTLTVLKWQTEMKIPLSVRKLRLPQAPDDAQPNDFDYILICKNYNYPIDFIGWMLRKT
jgi:hypothetical protein